MTSQLILLYVLKTIVVAGIFFGYNWLALRDKKFHYYNRFFLLLSLTLSLIIPLFNFSWFTVESPVLTSSTQVFNFMIESGKSSPGIQLDWMDWSLIGVGLVGIGLLLLLCVNIIKIYQLKQKAEVMHMDGFDFMSIEEEEAPFSFLDNLFWKKSILLHDNNGQKIFKHELTHIQQKHTWDRLYCQIVSSVLWMNPFSWLIQKELQTIHEFIADEEAVGNSDVASFAQMLLQTHYGNHFLNPSHSFFYSSIKRRLIMLTTSKKTKYSYVRRVMILPLLVLAVGVFSVKVNATERISNRVDALKAAVNEVIADTTKPLIATTLQGKDDKSAIKIDTIYFTKNDKNTDSSFSNKGMNKALFIVDGKKVSWESMQEINPKDIAYVNVLKGEQAASYGEAGKKGVVLITTKFGPPPPPPPPYIAPPPPPVFGVSVVGSKDAIVNKSGKDPLYVINGVPVKKNGINPVENINPNDIERIDVLKNKSAVSLYGKDGEDGVILITTKSASEKEKKSNNQSEKKEGSGFLVASKSTEIAQDQKTLFIMGKGILETSKFGSATERPLFVIDGVLSTEEAADKLNPNSIKSINVIKDKSAVKIYGNKAKFGVVSISTKQREAKSE